MEALQKLKNCGAQEILDNTSKAKAEQLMSDEQMEAYQEFLAAKAYQSFAVRRRDSKNITSTLKETHPMLEISPRDLDADCFLLCTPEATYDLRKGMAGAREHSADDFITKITSVSPGSKGAQLWQDNLDLIFQKDQQLIDYVQMICALLLSGKFLWRRSSSHTAMDATANPPSGMPSPACWDSTAEIYPQIP